MVELIESGKKQIVVDLSKATFIDSTTLGVLVGGVKRLRPAGGSLALVCTDDNITKIFEITGLDRVFPIHSSREEALAAVTAPTDQVALRRPRPGHLDLRPSRCRPCWTVTLPYSSTVATVRISPPRPAATDAIAHARSRQSAGADVFYRGRRGVGPVRRLGQGIHDGLIDVGLGGQLIGQLVQPVDLGLLLEQRVADPDDVSRRLDVGVRGELTVELLVEIHALARQARARSALPESASMSSACWPPPSRRAPRRSSRPQPPLQRRALQRSTSCAGCLLSESFIPVGRLAATAPRTAGRPRQSAAYVLAGL